MPAALSPYSASAHLPAPLHHLGDAMKAIAGLLLTTGVSPGSRGTVSASIVPTCPSRSTRGGGMRRSAILSLALVAFLGFVAPVSLFAQAAAPQPQLTITGIIDHVGTWTQNISIPDFNTNRNRDYQLYGRTRGRFDIIGEVGPAKGVFGFEIDAYWGQT